MTCLGNGGPLIASRAAHEPPQPRRGDAIPEGPGPAPCDTNVEALARGTPATGPDRAPRKEEADPCA